jgi:hypothetical protein
VKIVITAGHYTSLAGLFLLHAMLPGTARAQASGEIIRSKSGAPRDVKPAPNVELSPTNQPAVAHANLSLDELRALLHLYSRLNRPNMVEVVAGTILGRAPQDKETLQLLASFHFERNDAARALKYARLLVKFFPEEAYAHFLLASACKLDGQNRLALEILTKLKSEQFSGGTFPYEAELASVALLCGDWPQAVHAYQAALESTRLRPEERSEARDQLTELYKTHLPQLLAKHTFTHSQSGLIHRSLLDWSQPLAADHRLELELARDDLKLNRAEFLRPHWTYRYDALLGAKSNFRQWRTRLFGGLGDEGAVYGADLTRVLGGDEDLTLSFHGNQRATDSLLLETLHGREDELSLLWNARFYPEVLARVKLNGRRILIDGETLGHGFGVNLNLERAVFDALPEFHLGYRGLISSYCQQSQNSRLAADVAAPGTSAADQLNLLDDLVSPINLHGLFLSWHQTISLQWGWHAAVGGDYSFTRSSFGQSIESGFSYHPSRRTEFIFSAGYSTSASTSDQDSERVELSLGFRCHF